MKRAITLDRPEKYRIEIQGRLEESWRDAFGLEILAGSSEPPTTSLTGVVDQAALHGVLRRLYSIGLPLISIRCEENA